LSRAIELYDYWSQFPPVHVILAARYLDRSKMKKTVDMSPQRYERTQPNEAEATLIALASQTAVRTYDNCPEEVQAWLTMLKNKKTADA
jgi:hypothetical protein